MIPYQIKPDVGGENLILLVHVNDLLESQPEGEHHRLWLIRHRPLQLVVVSQQVLQQHSLVEAAVGSCKVNTVNTIKSPLLWLLEGGGAGAVYCDDQLSFRDGQSILICCWTWLQCKYWSENLEMNIAEQSCCQASSPSLLLSGIIKYSFLLINHFLRKLVLKRSIRS